jgi:hypothetical protein
MTGISGLQEAIIELKRLFVTREGISGGVLALAHPCPDFEISRIDTPRSLKDMVNVPTHPA